MVKFGEITHHDANPDRHLITGRCGVCGTTLIADSQDGTELPYFGPVCAECAQMWEDSTN